MAHYILDAAGFIASIYDGPGTPAHSTQIAPPADAAIPHQFVNGQWKISAIDQRITRLAFINRFKMEEWIKLDTAAESVPTIKYFLMQVNAARYIDLGREDVQMGVHLLAANGMLTEARATEILGAPILQVERLDPVAF